MKALRRLGRFAVRTVVGVAVTAATVAGAGVAAANPGDLDPQFGTGGIVGVADVALDDVAVQRNGKIVAAGTGLDTFVVLRFKPDGKPDTSFGGVGRVTTDFGTAVSAARAVAVAHGKVVAAGTAGEDFGRARTFAVARYNRDGSLDTTFDSDGKVTTDFGTSIADANGVAVQHDGKVVVAGYAAGAPAGEFALVRYNVDGSLDPTFGVDGRVTTDFGTGTELATDVVVQTDGKVVAVGLSQASGTDDFAVARYNADGMLDTAFDGDGRVTTDLAGYESAYAVALQANGRIIAVGPTSGFTGTGIDFAVVRYKADGSPDTRFGIGGTVTTDFASGDDDPFGVAVQPDGKIVVAGFATRSTTGSDVALARYRRNGSLDAGFGTGGLVMTDLGKIFELASAVTVQPDGRPVVAATETLLRYLSH